MHDKKVIIEADADEARHFFGSFFDEPEYEYETITDEETGIKSIVTKKTTKFKI